MNRLALALLVAAGLVLAHPQTALATPSSPVTYAVRASDTYLLVASSPSGPWTPSLDRTLFGGEGPIAPGVTLTDTFWVRNASSDVAVLTVASVADPATAQDPTAAYLHVAAAVASATASLDGAPDAGTLATQPRRLDARAMAPGETVPVTVAAGLPRATSGSQAEDATWERPVQIALNLQPRAVTAPSLSTAAPAGPVPGPDAGGVGPDGASSDLTASPLQGPLAHTGAEVGQLLAAGSAATLLGILLLAAARRRRRDDQEPNHR